MSHAPPILGVYLSDSLDLKALYGDALREGADDVVLRDPHEIDHPEDVRFAICWLPGERAFEPYPNLAPASTPCWRIPALMSRCGSPGCVIRTRPP